MAACPGSRRRILRSASVICWPLACRPGGGRASTLAQRCCASGSSRSPAAMPISTTPRRCATTRCSSSSAAARRTAPPPSPVRPPSPASKIASTVARWSGWLARWLPSISGKRALGTRAARPPGAHPAGPGRHGGPGAWHAGGGGYHAYYGQHRYHPLLDFAGDTGQLITAVLRPGNAHSNRLVVLVLRRLLRRLRAAWPGVPVELRWEAIAASLLAQAQAKSEAASEAKVRLAARCGIRRPHGPSSGGRCTKPRYSPKGRTPASS